MMQIYFYKMQFEINNDSSRLQIPTFIIISLSFKKKILWTNKQTEIFNF
jgi:hypothetical protein